MACPLAAERIWTEKSLFSDAERKYYEGGNKTLIPTDKIEMVAFSEPNAECTISDLSEPKSPVKKARKSKKEKKPSPQVAKSNDKINVAEPVSPKTVLETKPTDVASVSPPKTDAKDAAKAKKQRKRDKKQAALDETAGVAKNNTNSLPLVKKAVPNSPPVADDETNNNSIRNEQAGQQSALVSEIAKARQHIKNSLERMDGIAALAANPSNINDRLQHLEKDNQSLRDVVEQLKKASLQSEERIKLLETRLSGLQLGAAPVVAAAAPAAASKASDDDDGVDLFGSDSEDEDDTAAKLREARLAEYANKKSKKTAIIAKSNIILDIKPWDDETDMKLLEAEVRKIIQDGLLWGAAKLVPIAYGILKLQISCVVEDDKVSIDELTEKLEAIEDYVQSVDIAAFNKI